MKKVRRISKAETAAQDKLFWALCVFARCETKASQKTAIYKRADIIVKDFVDNGRLPSVGYEKFSIRAKAGK